MKTMRNQNRVLAICALTAAFMLSACNKTPEQPSELIEDNMMVEVPIDDGAASNVVDAAAAENVALNVTNGAAPPPAFTDTEQMRDDADATGLTARLPADDAANEIQPAQ
jgi:ABC-type oligopeptide transport system substrate-binding subunit